MRATCARMRSSASPSRSSCCTCGRWRDSCSATSAPRCRWRSRAACSRRATSLRKRLEHRLRSAVPGAQIRAGEVIPARGAVAARALRRGDDRRADGAVVSRQKECLALVRGVTIAGTLSGCPASASATGVSSDDSSNAPSQRAITTVARQLPTRLIDVRAMSISASTPRMTATPCERQAELRERAGENHERRARHRGHAFAREHQRQHHEDLLRERHVDARRLRRRTPTPARDRACCRRD